MRVLLSCVYNLVGVFVFMNACHESPLFLHVSHFFFTVITRYTIPRVIVLIFADGLTFGPFHVSEHRTGISVLYIAWLRTRCACGCIYNSILIGPRAVPNN